MQLLATQLRNLQVVVNTHEDLAILDKVKVNFSKGVREQQQGFEKSFKFVSLADAVAALQKMVVDLKAGVAGHNGPCNTDVAALAELCEPALELLVELLARLPDLTTLKEQSELAATQIEADRRRARRDAMKAKPQEPPPARESDEIGHAVPELMDVVEQLDPLNNDAVKALLESQDREQTPQGVKKMRPSG